MPIRQCFVYPCFANSDRSMEAVIDAAAGIGYSAVEFWGWHDGLDDVVRRAKGAGLSIASFTGHESIDRGPTDPAEHDRVVDELKRSLDRASEIGARAVIALAGSTRPGVDLHDQLAAVAECLARVTDHAEGCGVDVNLEILNSKVNHPGYLVDATERATWIVDRVAHPRVRVLFDIYHVQVMEGDVIRRMRDLGPRIGHIHTAGNPGRHDLDDGELNYSGIATAIEAMGYDGFVGHEFFTRLDDRIEALRRAYAVMASTQEYLGDSNPRQPYRPTT